MKRTIVLAVLVVAALAGQPAADAQSLAPVPLIGVLRYGVVSGRDQFTESFRQGLRELGYVEGKNVAVDWRSVEGRSERAPGLASELVRLKVNIIVADGAAAAEAARNATRKIPIVLAGADDPVGAGLVKSLARPGGNVTGVSLNLRESAGKQMELLRQVFPGLARAAFLASTRDPAARLCVEETQRAGQRLGIRVQGLMVAGVEELEGAFAAMQRERAEALVIQPIFSEPLPRILDLAARDRMPTVSFRRDFAEAGALMTYGPDLREVYRRSAIYVDKILKGAKPRDLPVAEPTKYDLVVNLRTAGALGLTIPQPILGRADHVIQ